mmetsp:Transcript_2696/g.6031  ORF Transcript_2696/g.6031 Transcript_2696/m.6031 type:complete len:221 (-) Transcript_2696:183-845(-)
MRSRSSLRRCSESCATAALSTSLPTLRRCSLRALSSWAMAHTASRGCSTAMRVSARTTRPTTAGSGCPTRDTNCWTDVYHMWAGIRDSASDTSSLSRCCSSDRAVPPARFAFSFSLSAFSAALAFPLRALRPSEVAAELLPWLALSGRWGGARRDTSNQRVRRRGMAWKMNLEEVARHSRYASTVASASACAWASPAIPPPEAPLESATRASRRRPSSRS